MSCHDIEERGGSRCAEFAKHLECECETVQTTSYSPGPVQNDEWLMRHIFSPLHVDEETKQPKPQAFLDMWGAGFSVTRREHVAKDAFGTLTERLVTLKKEKSCALEGVLLLSVREIRHLRWQGDTSRMLCVYDTGLEENPAHADVCTPRIPPSRRKKAELRDCLTGMCDTLCIDWTELFA